jgi:hypothetical protein
MAILRPDSLVDSYFVLLEDAAAAADQLFPNVTKRLEAVHPPNVRYREEMVSTGLWASVSGRKRKFLQVSNEISGLKNYIFYITSEPYGTALSVGWYLSGQAGFAKRLAQGVARAYTMGVLSAGNLDLFESQELQNFGTVVHNCVAAAADDILLAGGAGQSQVARKTRGGFLGTV